MSFKKSKPYYNTPLNISNTVDLPSNLLQSRRQPRPSETAAPGQHRTLNVTPRESETAPRARKEPVMVIEEKNKSRRSVLYKRLTDIKSQNEELERYSYSKLLSKMVIIDPAASNYNTLDLENDNLRTISEYSCLRGKLLNMDCEEELETKPRRERAASNCNDYSNRTTRIFKRFYKGASGQKMQPSFFQQQSSPQQKYIYINGKKTECKRIHNFYTSQNFRQSYDKAFGRTRDSFYPSRADSRY